MRSITLKIEETPRGQIVFEMTTSGTGTGHENDLLTGAHGALTKYVQYMMTAALRHGCTVAEAPTRAALHLP